MTAIEKVERRYGYIQPICGLHLNAARWICCLQHFSHAGNKIPVFRTAFWIADHGDPSIVLLIGVFSDFTTDLIKVKSNIASGMRHIAEGIQDSGPAVKCALIDVLVRERGGHCYDTGYAHFGNMRGDLFLPVGGLICHKKERCIPLLFQYELDAIEKVSIPLFIDVWQDDGNMVGKGNVLSQQLCLSVCHIAQLLCGVCDALNFLRADISAVIENVGNRSLRYAG